MDSFNKLKIVDGKYLQMMLKMKVERVFTLMLKILKTLVGEMVKGVLHSLTSQLKNKHLQYQKVSLGLSFLNRSKYQQELNKVQV